jgi:hypothetical protein
MPRICKMHDSKLKRKTVDVIAGMPGSQMLIIEENYPYHGLYSWTGGCIVYQDQPDTKFKYVCEECHTLAKKMSNDNDLGVIEIYEA